MVPGVVEISAPVVTLSLPLVQPYEPRMLIQSPLHIRAGAFPDTIVTANRLMMTAGLRRTGPTPVAFHGVDLRLEAAD